MKSICVFCGSAAGKDPTYAAAAVELGTLMGHRGIRLVYGGGGIGIMGAVARAVIAAGGSVIGVVPRFMMGREAVLTEGLDLRVVADMYERKRLMTELADAFITLPGGVGTLEELFEVWAHAHIGLHAKPIGILNTRGYYDELLSFVDRGVRDGFIRTKRQHLIVSGAEPAALVDKLDMLMPS